MPITAIGANQMQKLNAKPATTATNAKPAKPARVKAVKPAAQKPVIAETPAIVAKPDTSDKQAERIAAFEAICAFYSGTSQPFKSASDTFSLFRTDKAPKAATNRQAALIAAMLLAGDNIQPDGTFKRGGFTHNGRSVQPETGCLSDMHGRILTYVSGALIGSEARNATFRIDLAKARAEISARLGDKLGKLPLAKIDKLLAA